MNSQDFTLTSDGTVIFSTTDNKDYKILSMIISNESDADTNFSLLVDNVVLDTDTVRGQYAKSLLDDCWFAQEGGTELKATGSGLTLHLVYEEVDG